MKVRVVPAEGEPFELDLKDGSIVVGRSSTADRVIADLYASRHHARLTMRGESLLVEDLGSRNGTYVNDRRVVGKVEVHTGDVIRIAGSTLRRVEQGERISDAMTRGAASSSAALDSTVIRAGAEILDEISDSVEVLAGGEALRRYARRLKTLRGIHRAFSRATTRADLLRSALDWAFELFAPDQGAIYLRGSDGELRKEGGRPADAQGMLLPERMVAQVLQQGLAVATRAESLQQVGEPASPSTVFLIAAPLLDGGKSFGMLALSRTTPWQCAAREQLELLVELAGEAALEIKKLGLAEEAAQRRLLQRELELARHIQLNILPDETPDFEGYRFLTRNIPSRGVSGDFYSLTLRREGEECVLFMGDVSGKGFPAALLTASVEAFSAVMVAAAYPPHQICTELSRQLFERTPSSAFVTAFVGVLDRQSGRLVYTNAGDNPALLARPDGALSKLASVGLPLAVMAGTRYESREVVMEPGATLLLYTDGIIEAHNRDNEQYGMTRLEGRFLEARHAALDQIFTTIQTDLAEFVGEVPYADDRTVILVRRSASG